MTLKLTIPYAAAFLSLMFIMHEAHELAHTAVGRLICGCWGPRDFNLWDLCDGCTEREPLFLLAIFAGPVFTFLMAGYGAYLMSPTKTGMQKAMGFSLVFANKPFAHLFTAAIGKGDTVSALNRIWDNHAMAWIIGFLILVALAIIPLIKAWNIIGNKNKLAWFVLFFMVPTFIDGLVITGILNKVLNHGFLSAYWMPGSPMLVTLWMFACTCIFILLRKKIYLLNGSLSTEKTQKLAFGV